MCRHVLAHADICADTCRCRHVPTSVILIIWTFLFANWDVLACVSTWKSGKVPTRADTSRCRHVPTSLILIIWTFLFGCWYVLTCVSTWKGADTWEGADTSRCRHVPTSVILIIWTFYLDADMCWHVSAPEKVQTPGKVPKRADTSRCRHVPTSVILIIWTFLFANWDVLACVSTWKSADTWEGHTGPTIDNLNPIWVRLLGQLQLSNPWDLHCCLRIEFCKFVPTSAGLEMWS